MPQPITYQLLEEEKKNLATLTNCRLVELILGSLNRLHFKVPKKTRFEV